jgi:hypothetical protein
MKLSKKQIRERFAATTPNEEMAEKIRNLRENFIIFAEVLNNELPEGRAKEMAMDYFEDTSMWAIKALSREPIGYEYVESPDKVELTPGADETDRWKELKQIPEPGTTEWDRQNPADGQTVKHDI